MPQAPTPEVRCERCRFTIKAYERNYDGWCAVCAGKSSFVCSSAQSELNAQAFEERARRYAEGKVVAAEAASKRRAVA